MNRVVCRLAAGMILFVLAGCASTPQPNAVMGEDLTDPTEAGLLDEYRIGVGDVLNVSVWRNPELSTQATVLPDGTIAVPLVGDVSAAGESTGSLTEAITNVLSTYIREPQVTVSVLSASSSEYLQRVRITGAVNGPLSIVYRRGLTVLDLVLLAGGVTPFANADKALLYRNVGDELKVYPVKLQDILSRGKLETNYKLLPADIITVPEKSF
ncbi:MAG: XrtA/PEP-CTERM system exopolysaccharide export protein [Pseudomonadota bacterium]